jgi:hypothetical protein
MNMKDIDWVDGDLAMGSCPLAQSWDGSTFIPSFGSELSLAQ